MSIIPLIKSVVTKTHNKIETTIEMLIIKILNLFDFVIFQLLHICKKIKRVFGKKCKNLSNYILME